MGVTHLVLISQQHQPPSKMNPLNALFLAVAVAPALAAAAPQPTFGSIIRDIENKKEEKKEKKGKDKDDDDEKEVLYIVRPSYAVHQSYHPISHHSGYGSSHHTVESHGYGAPIGHGYGSPIPVHTTPLKPIKAKVLAPEYP